MKRTLNTPYAAEEMCAKLRLARPGAGYSGISGDQRLATYSPNIAQTPLGLIQRLLNCYNRRRHPYQ